MKHRDASDSKRFRILCKTFIERYGIDTSRYDVIQGWRADASFFYLARAFARDEIDIRILEDILRAASPGIEYCLKSEKAFSQLQAVCDSPETVDPGEYTEKFAKRDRQARVRMRAWIDSEQNGVQSVFSTLTGEINE